MIDERVFESIQTRLPAGLTVPETTTGVHWFLYGLVRLHQPELVVEIGTCRGDATAYLARAVLHNGHGRVEGYEARPDLQQQTRAKINAAVGEDAPVIIHGPFPLNGGGPQIQADFVFLDLDPKRDYYRALNNLCLPPGGLLIAHDLTYPPDAKTVHGFGLHLREQGYEVLELPQERGLVVARVATPNKETT